MFSVFVTLSLLVSGVFSFLTKEVPRDTQRLCAALYKLPLVPDNDLFREARVLAESSAVCRKSHFWVWEKMNPMEIEEIKKMDLRVQEAIRHLDEEQRKADKEKEKALAESRDLKMVHIYKRRYQNGVKCLAANLWTHDIRAQVFPILKNNPTPVFTKMIVDLKPVKISFDDSESYELPLWYVYVYVIYIILGFKFLGLPLGIMAIFRLTIILCKVVIDLLMFVLKGIIGLPKNIYNITIIILDFMGYCQEELFMLVIRLTLILTRIAINFVLFSLAICCKVIRFVCFLYEIIDQMDIFDIINCAVVALVVLFFILTFLLLADKENPVIAESWFYISNVLSIYVGFELMISIGLLTDYRNREAERQQKEKAKKSRSSLSSSKSYWICRVAYFEKKAGLLISRDLIDVLRLLKEMCRVTPLVYAIISALLACLISSELTNVFFEYIISFILFYALLFCMMLIRNIAEDFKASIRRKRYMFTFCSILANDANHLCRYTRQIWNGCF